MSSTATVPESSDAENQGKATPGRGYVVVVYGLFIGSIMAVVTAPVGACIAHMRLGRSAQWLDTHLQFQLRTFWLGIVAALLAVMIWLALPRLGVSSVYAWTFGYLFFTIGMVWMMARCAVGIHRLTSNEGIEEPKSWLFGVGRRT